MGNWLFLGLPLFFVVTSRLKGHAKNLATLGFFWAVAIVLGVNGWKSYAYAAALSTPYQLAYYKPKFLYVTWFSLTGAAIFLVLSVAWYYMDERKDRSISKSSQAV